jgi:hypothetical protein
MDVEDLEKRIQALEVGATFDTTKSQVQKVEEEFLLKLREIRTTIVAEAESSGGGDGGGALSAVDSKDLKELRKENELLNVLLGIQRKKNAKMEYRLSHVVDSLDKLYDEHKTLEKKAKDLVSRASF